MLTSTNTEGINMYLKKITLITILLGFAACAGLANADDNAAGAWGQNMSPEQREAAKQRYNSATPEQQEAYRKKMENYKNASPEQQEAYRKKMEMRKQKMENMTPEQQAELKTQQEQRKKQWQSMTPEQREAVKQKYRNQQQ
jgi:phosphoglycerol transferase MdoB-like AlkP superfamily enzyme